MIYKIYLTSNKKYKYKKNKYGPIWKNKNAFGLISSNGRPKSNCKLFSHSPVKFYNN